MNTRAPLAELSCDDGSLPHTEQLRTASNGLRDPVLLPGLCQSEVDKGIWTLDYVMGAEPDASVTAEYYSDADRRQPYVHVSKPFGELARDMADEPTKWFLAELDLDEVFSSVASELAPLPVLPTDAEHVLRLVFFGNDSQSATHFHVRDQAILAHLTGVKRVIMVPPEATRQLATNSRFGGRPQFSTHGPEVGQDALECFTDLVGDAAFQVDIRPGDALFIPVHWWHWVEGEGECLSVTTFWRAGLREWAFPAPGFRAATAVGLDKIARVVRRGAAAVTSRRRVA